MTDSDTLIEAIKTKFNNAPRTYERTVELTYEEYFTLEANPGLSPAGCTNLNVTKGTREPFILSVIAGAGPDPQAILDALKARGVL